MKDLSTLEYLYDLRCWRASSDTHSCLAVSGCSIKLASNSNASRGVGVPLLGAMVVDWVTGGGSDMDARGGLG
jgi:hypothetical protein